MQDELNLNDKFNFRIFYFNYERGFKIKEIFLIEDSFKKCTNCNKGRFEFAAIFALNVGKKEQFEEKFYRNNNSSQNSSIFKIQDELR